MFRPERVRPERQTIFGDTYRGVPNPMVAVERGYPTRNHGPIFTYVMPSYRYQRRPVARAPYAGLGGMIGDLCKAIGGTVTPEGCALPPPFLPPSPPATPVAPCGPGGQCPAGQECCNLSIYDPGMPDLCTTVDKCTQAINPIERQLCKNNPDWTLESSSFTYRGYTGVRDVCVPPEAPAPPTVPSALTTPPSTTPTSQEGPSGGLTVPKVALVAAGVIFVLALLS